MVASLALRLIGYGRVSTDDQAEYGFGLPTQNLENTAYAERIGAALVGYEEDPGISGTIYPRPAMERALKRIEAGEANGLLVHRVDRIGRKLWIPPVVFERLLRAGARLLTVQDGEVTESNVLMFSIRCGMAQTDYHQIVSNMRAGKRRTAESGLGMNRHTPPFGYHIRQKIEQGIVQTDPGTYHILEEQAATIRLIYLWCASGMTLVEICKRLQEKGIPPPRPPKVRTAGTWLPNTVRRILINPVYRGTAVWGGVEIPVPAIVDTDLWEHCQAVIEGNKATCWRKDRAHLLSGLLVCPSCARRMKVRLGGVTKAGHRAVYYRCRPTADEISPEWTCDRRNHNERNIRAALLAVLRRLATDPAFAATSYASHVGQGADDGAEQIAAAQTKLVQLQSREEATARAQITAIETGASAAVYEKLLREISQERMETERRAAALAITSVRRQAVESVDVGSLASTVAGELLEVLEAEELSEVGKNGILRRLVDRIVPVEGGYEVWLRPFVTGQSVVPVTAMLIAVTGTTLKARWREV